tara:strand:- start:1170 stop:1379 length:210 start_codon:yes stop_codon:yes gene_type:complete
MFESKVVSKCDIDGTLDYYRNIEGEWTFVLAEGTLKLYKTKAKVQECHLLDLPVYVSEKKKIGNAGKDK